MTVGNENVGGSEQPAAQTETRHGRRYSIPPGRGWSAFRHSRYFVPVCLILILLVGSYFRFTGVNWDSDTHLHPDERFVWMVTISLSLPKSIGEYFNTAVSPLNPYNNGSSFIYGTLPIFLTKWLGEVLKQGHPDRIHLLGRMLAAIFDLISVFLMFLIGRKLYDERVGLLSAFLTACLAIHIQQSHFYSADSFVATFVLLTFYCSLYVAERGRWSDFVWMGLSFGLAVASKINVILFGPIMALACVLRIYNGLRRPAPPVQPESSLSALEAPSAAPATELVIGTPSRCDGVGTPSRYDGVGTPSRYDGGGGDVQGGWLHWSRKIGDLGLSLSVERPGVTASGTPSRSSGAGQVPRPQAVAEQREPHWLRVGYDVAVKFVVSLLVAFFAFRIVQPYSFRGPGFFGLRFAEAWLNDVRYWAKAAAGQVDLPFNDQWTSRAPVLFSLQNMVLWAVGLPLGLASWAGWAWAWYELLRKRALKHALVLVWTTAFFLYQSTRFGKLSRYLTPFFPFMAMLAAYLIVQVWDRARAGKIRWAIGTPSRCDGGRSLDVSWARVAAGALAVAVLVGTFLWAFAFSRIYTRPLTRVTASLWVYDNIPAGSAIGNEHWDDSIPWGGVGGRNGYADGTYTWVEFHPYAEDEPIKLEWFMDWLGQSDYIILSSNRLYGSIPRLPMRFPMTARYYKYLFNGELGFDLIKTFTSRPNLGPIEFNDDNSEEPFTVYDHPRVDVFKKTERFSLEKARSLLGDGIDWDGIARLMPIQVPNWQNGLQMTEEETQAQRSGGTWSAIFNRRSLSNAAPVFIWLLLLELLGLITLPLADRLFESLPDRGYSLSKTLGILLLTWLTWMMVSLGLTTFSRAAISVALVLLTGFSAILFLGTPSRPDGGRRREHLRSFWRQNRRLIVVNEVLFLLFFFGFLLIRYGNPDLWHPVMGGEKPMDFAYLNAVIKSSVFPPYDPWYAGGYLNYYYFGQIILGTLIKLTGIVPSVAYNLSIPLLASLTAMGAFCVVYNLTTRQDRDVDGLGTPSRPDGGRNPAVFWGLAAALLVAVLGNLGEIGVWMQALREIGTVDAKSSIPYVADLARVLSGLLRWISHQARPNIRPEWPYWNPSRIMTNGEINEFPFFTFLYADLHAHLIGLPFTLLALGLAVAVVLRKARPLLEGGLFLGTPSRPDGGGTADLGEGASASLKRAQSLHLFAGVEDALGRVDWAELFLLGAIGLVVGALRPINSWDYPTYLLVAFVALALRQYEEHQQINAAVLWAVAWRAGLVLALSILFMQPFLSRFGTAYTSIERWKGPRTGLGTYLVIHGLFLFLIVSRMVVELFGRDSARSGHHSTTAEAGRSTSRGVLRIVHLSLRHWDRLPRLFALYGRLVHEGREFDSFGWAATAILLLLLAWLVKAKQWFFILVILLILGTLWIVLQVGTPLPKKWQDSASRPDGVGTPSRPDGVRMEAKRRFLWLLFGMGLALSLGVDLVVLKGDIGRMNTVFKFYLQIWVLWSVVAVFSLSELAERLRGWPQPRRRLWMGILAALVFLAALYPIAATKAKINDRFDSSVRPTLDGMAYMQRAVYYDGEPIELKWDYAAINWLLNNVQGSPVIAEGNTEPRGLYRWGSRVAIYTGLPTIIGWSWHQRQQRSAMPDQWVSRRLDDVYRLYSDASTDVALELLRKYEVRYVYVGDVERIYYPASGLEKFEVMRAEGLLNLVYHNERVRIYEVVGTPLPKKWQDSASRGDGVGRE